LPLASRKRTRLSRLFRPDKMSREEYKKYRFIKNRERKYPGGFNKLIFPYQRGLISVFLTIAHPDTASSREVLGQLARQTYRSYELWIFIDSDEILDALDSQIPLDLRERIRSVSVLSEQEGDCNFNPQGEFLVWLDQSSTLAADGFESMVTRLRSNISLQVLHRNMDRQHGFLSYPLMISSLAAWLVDFIPRSNLSPEWELFWHCADLMLDRNCLDQSDPASELPGPSRESGSADTILDKYDIRIDAQQDFLLAPSVFRVIEKGSSQRCIHLAQRVREAITRAGNYLDVADHHPSAEAPAFWTSKIILVITDSPVFDDPELKAASGNAFVVLICCSSDNLPGSLSEEWGAGFVFSPNPADLPKMKKAFQGWIGFDDVASALSFVDARAHLYHLKRGVFALNDPIEQVAHPRLRASIIITTYRRTNALRNALRSAVEQTYQHQDYEILVVNNDPQDSSVSQVIEEVRTEKPMRPDMIREIQCVVPGLSHARNAGISAAVGEVICFLDDDALAHASWLEQIVEAFAAHPEAGVIGGHIQLIIPEPRPKILHAGLERYWTHFLTSYQQYTEVSQWLEFPWGANWCARRCVLFEIGGFRSQYGRKKKDFSGGEEIIAASQAKMLGYSIAILPGAIVDHCPAPDRYTYRYLCNTIAAQSIVNYRMARDLYLPKNVSMSHNLRGVGNFIRRFSHIMHLPAQLRKARMIESFCFMKAWPRLFYEQMNDNFSRAFYHE